MTNYTPELLREEAANIECGTIINRAQVAKDYRAHADALERLKVAEEALADIREVWAGAECGEPVTAQEGYMNRLCHQQFAAACEALAAIKGE